MLTRRPHVRTYVALAALLAAMHGAHADVLRLKDGRELIGRVAARSDGVILYTYEDGSTTKTELFKESDMIEVVWGSLTTTDGLAAAPDETVAVPPADGNEQVIEQEDEAPPTGAAQAEMSDRHKLFAAMSEGYKVGSVSVNRRPNIGVVCEMTESQDSAVADLAKKAAAMITVYQTAEQNLDLNEEVRRLRREFLEYAAVSWNSSFVGSMQDAADAFGQQGGVFDDAITKYREGMRGSLVFQEMSNALREDLKDLALRTAQRELPADQVALRFTPGKGAGGLVTTGASGYLTITNKTKAPLKRVLVVVDVYMDSDKIDALWADEYRHWEIAKALEGALGVDEELWNDRVDSRRMELERTKLGYGNMIFVPTIGAGSTVKVDVGQLGDIDRIMDRVCVTLATDEVYIQPPCVPADSMREVIQKIVLAQMQREQKKRPRR